MNINQALPSNPHEISSASIASASPPQPPYIDTHLEPPDEGSRRGSTSRIALNPSTSCS